MTTTISRASSLITRERALQILQGEGSIPQIIAEASIPRFQYFGNSVRIHILDNLKNGHCPEDCGYCAQRKGASSGVQEYSMKSPEEIWNDAKKAKENGAYRFCMVTSGRGPTDKSTEQLANVIRKINSELGLRVCLSAGILDESKAKVLKDAGLDRYNHNLNTTEAHYKEICNTHTFQDRVNTLSYAKEAGIGLCSGVIVGMGESLEDWADLAFETNKYGVVSIPVNFFIPISGHAIRNPNSLTPEICLRILSVFRLVNPDSEIRIGAGREGHLRNLQGMALYVANSLFAEGYLNVKGSNAYQSLQLIRDCGFEPESEEGNLPVGDDEYLYSSENIPNLYKFKK